MIAIYFSFSLEINLNFTVNVNVRDDISHQLLHYNYISNMLHHKYKDKSFSGVNCQTSLPAKRVSPPNEPLRQTSLPAKRVSLKNCLRNCS